MLSPVVFYVIPFIKHIHQPCIAQPVHNHTSCNCAAHCLLFPSTFTVFNSCIVKRPWFHPWCYLYIFIILSNISTVTRSNDQWSSSQPFFLSFATLTRVLPHTSCIYVTWTHLGLSVNGEGKGVFKWVLWWYCDRIWVVNYLFDHTGTDVVVTVRSSMKALCTEPQQTSPACS